VVNVLIEWDERKRITERKEVMKSNHRTVSYLMGMIGVLVMIVCYSVQSAFGGCKALIVAISGASIDSNKTIHVVTCIDTPITPVVLCVSPEDVPATSVQCTWPPADYTIYQTYGWAGNYIDPTNEQDTTFSHTWEAHGTDSEGITGTIWFKDCKGNLLCPPASDSVTIEVTIPILQSLSLVSGATSLDPTNCAVVKTNDYVILQAALYPNTTNAASLLSWSGGEAVPGNLFQRRVSRATSAMTTVTASCCETSISENVWIVWADLTVKVGGTLDSDDHEPLFFEDGNWPSNYGGWNLGGGNSLGPIDHMGVPSLTYAYTMGKIEAKAILQPTGIGNIITNKWDMKRNRIVTSWDNGGRSTFNPAPGVYDASNPYTKALTPVNGAIFSTDTPGCSAVLPNITIDHTAEVYDNFYQFVTVDLGSGAQICSDTQTWSYTAIVDVDDPTNKVQLNTLSTSLINIPTNSLFPPR